MRRLRSLAVLGFVAAALALTGGCSGGPGDTVDVVVIGESTSLFDGGARLSPAAQLLRGASAQGLVALDQQGQVIPGIADRWIVTDDGLSYIFRLSDGSWNGGGKLAAAPVRAALMQSLAALRGTALGKDLAGIEEVRVMTGRVVEIRLSRPQPDLLLLLAQPELGLLGQGQGRGAGPMALRRDGKVAYLALIDPQLRGLPASADWKEAVRPVRLRALPAEAAIARFERGESDAVLGGRYESFPLADAGGLSRGAVRLDPVGGLFGLAVVHGDGFLADPQNREVISMAIDRDALPAALGIGGWSMTERIVPAENDGNVPAEPQKWLGLSMEERQSVAASRIARWRSAMSEPVRLRIALPAGPGTDRLFASLAESLGKAGLIATRVGLADPADLRLVDAVARYPGSLWFFHQLSCGVLPGPCDPNADGLVVKAAQTTDPAGRAALLAQAEERLAASNVYIPLGAPIRWSLLRGNATGFVVNRFAIHPLMPMALLPK